MAELCNQAIERREKKREKPSQVESEEEEEIVVEKVDTPPRVITQHTGLPNSLTVVQPQLFMDFEQRKAAFIAAARKVTHPVSEIDPNFSIPDFRISRFISGNVGFDQVVQVMQDSCDTMDKITHLFKSQRAYLFFIAFKFSKTEVERDENFRALWKVRTTKDLKANKHLNYSVTTVNKYVRIGEFIYWVNSGATSLHFFLSGGENFKDNLHSRHLALGTSASSQELLGLSQ